MATLTRLIKFETQTGEQLWANIGDSDIDSLVGTSVDAFPNLSTNHTTQSAIIHKLLAPVPDPCLPIYCVGLNYHSHAKEASLPIPKNPPLWLKPAAALANPYEDIPISKFCAESLPDYEGELVFITSRPCKDVSVEEASKYILGYTLGNDISCRKFQTKDEQGGQFFFAKAFDKFAPIGPALLHPTKFHSHKTQLSTSINGDLLQNAKIPQDMLCSPERILSFMSTGTTIPEGTVVMTGTPAGVGWFQKPESRLLKDGNVVDVSVEGIGRLRNRVVFV